MLSMIKGMASVVAVFSLLTLNVARADDAKPTDGGKGSEFKSKSYEMKDKGETSIVLSFEAGKEVTVTTKGDKETDISLAVKSMYFEAKDTSPSPKCLIKFTPVENDGKFTLTIKNNGPGTNKVTVDVKVAE